MVRTIPLSRRLSVRPRSCRASRGSDRASRCSRRVHSTTSIAGITLKADVSDDMRHRVVGVHLPGADWHEAWEMFGIDFVGHPRLLHIYLPGDVRGPSVAQGTPARRSHGEAVAGHRRRRALPRRGERRPRTRATSRGCRGRVVTAVTDRQQLSYVASQVADARVNVELESRGMTLYIGPRRPRRTAHWRHRQARRRASHRSRPGDGLHAPRLREAHRGPHVPSGHDAHQPHRLVGQLFANEVPFILAAERLMEIEAPPRAQWIRTSACSS